MTASREVRRVAAVLAGLLLLIVLPQPPTAGRAGDPAVDLALVLAIDCSFSVDSREFALQMEGLGRALMSDEVKAAIRQGARRRIAVAAFQWSDDRSQKLVLPWTVIGGGAETDALGLAIMGIRRQFEGGATSISAALVSASNLLDAGPAAERRVVDVSTDGRNNSGHPVGPVRDAVVARGITINGLTILNEWPTLDTYFERNVAGGPGHFVIPANDYDAYGEAILRKLLREIAGPGIS